MWFTGLSGSGKSTVALAVEAVLLREQVAPETHRAGPELARVGPAVWLKIPTRDVVKLAAQSVQVWANSLHGAFRGGPCT